MSAQPSKDEAERGQKIIKLATKIMQQGCRGWSDALKQASEKVK